MRIGKILLLTVSFVALPLFISNSASAQDNAALVKSHYEVGQAYYDQGRYQDAIKEFEEAYRLSQRPALLFNIAQAYERMGKLDKVQEYLKRCLAAPNIKNRQAIEERLKNIEERLRQTNVQINCEVADADVFIDGKHAGKTPLSAPLPVEPGSHEIKVFKKGYSQFSGFVSVVAGLSVPVTVKLTPGVSTEPPPVIGTPSGKEAPSAVTTETAAATESGPVAASDGKSRKRFWTWVAMGTGGGLVLVGGLVGMGALGKANDAKTSDDDTAKSAKTLAAVSDTCMVLGAAAVITGAVLYFYEGKSTEAPKTAIWTPYVTTRGAGLSAAFTF